MAGLARAIALQPLFEEIRLYPAPPLTEPPPPAVVAPAIAPTISQEAIEHAHIAIAHAEATIEANDLQAAFDEMGAA